MPETGACLQSYLLDPGTSADHRSGHSRWVPADWHHDSEADRQSNGLGADGTTIRPLARPCVPPGRVQVPARYALHARACRCAISRICGRKTCKGHSNRSHAEGDRTGERTHPARPQVDAKNALIKTGTSSRRPRCALSRKRSQSFFLAWITQRHRIPEKPVGTNPNVHSLSESFVSIHWSMPHQRKSQSRQHPTGHHQKARREFREERSSHFAERRSARQDP